jgi:GntR family transcriptional regulator/MocR family aminotransferase
MMFPFTYADKLAECGSKHLALYLAIREAIAEGKLAPGEKLPSTRRLASLYGLSRGSVSVAYEMLTAEGFVQAGVGQGTFVSGWEDRQGAPSSGKLGEPTAEPTLTEWGRRLMKLQPGPIVAIGKGTDGEGGSIAPKVSFIPEGVGQERFPWLEWKAEVALQWKRFGSTWMKEAYTTEGSLTLRQAIARRLRRERGISCEAEDIVITAGSMQAIALLTQLLLEEGKTAVLENPGYRGIQRAIDATGARRIVQDVDASGIVPHDWDAQLLFVTPTRQFPTGAVLSYERRRALLAWASRRNAWIVEDDYDSDFRFGGRPIEPLKSLDREGRVVYVGTVSRTMSVGVRIGYAVVPKQLKDPLIYAKRLYDPHPTGIAEQQALASWMSEGGFDRHMRRMRRMYGKLEHRLRTAIEGRLGDLFELAESDAGLHLYAKWKKSEEQYLALLQACESLGVAWRDGAVYDLGIGRNESSLPPEFKPERTALFGFAHLEEEQIEEGIDLICQAARSLNRIGSDAGQGGLEHA